MYQCLKVSTITKGERIYFLSKFLDSNRAEVFTVYTSSCPPFEVGTSYELSLQPNFTGLNFLSNDI